MIELTVKTLDSQNHAFTVEEDMTVAEFKEKIADTVNIPADTQRIIYCGRVLQDELKLIDCDVHGKVVHLVERAPPSSNSNADQQSDIPSPQPHRRLRGLEYLRFPGTTLDPQNILPTSPNHALAASRLTIAKRMLRRANAALDTLDNLLVRPPNDQGIDIQVAADNTATSDEPSNNAQSSDDPPMPEANTGPSEDPQVLPLDSNLENENIISQINSEGEIPHSLSSTPEASTPVAVSENSTNTPDVTENIPRTMDYAELLDSLTRLNIRFAPFLERYNDFMRDDPEVPLETLRPTQALINRVSEILHYLGHAYHALSDIIIRARSPPPRPLLCRPILIQHSAIVQAGIPIQVEAQINFSSDHNGTASSHPSTTATTNQTATTTSTTSSNTTASTNVHPTMVGFPLIPGSNVRLDAFQMPQPSNLNQHNNNREMPYISVRSTSELTGQSDSSTSDTETTSSSNAPNAASHNEPNLNVLENGIATNFMNRLAAVHAASTSSNGTSNNSNNPNVEFFMEVTPESITIDSLETSFVGVNQANDILQGSLRSPPPQLIQSIMQMAGQFITRGPPNTSSNTSSNTSNSVTTSVATTSSQDSASADPQLSSTSNGGAARTTPFQNSQARGNTQTQPTTSTHTRSTARPHVHLAQHAIQSFDPFLPCNSHHVALRQRVVQLTAAQLGNQQNRSDLEDGNDPPNGDPNNPFYGIMRNIINSVRTAYNGQNNTAQSSQSTTNSSTASANNSNSNLPNSSNSYNWMSTLRNMNLTDTSSRPLTIAQILQQHPDEIYREGESIFADLIMLLTRNLTIGDIMDINGGRIEPLMRIRNQLRNFFLFRILNGGQGTAAIERAVDRLMTEMQPFLEHFGLMETRNDIDLMRSVQALLRDKLPSIISLMASRIPNSIKLVVNQIRITSRIICCLAMVASRNGQQGVERVFDIILSRSLHGLPRELQQWTILTIRSQIASILSNLIIPQTTLQPYIVRNVDAVTSTISDTPTESETTLMDMEAANSAESISIDEQSTTTVTLTDDSEPLPAIVLGSEQWHSQVPSNWVPIISRDSQRQRKQNSQPPYSDAYLSGMPSKRRKIVTSTKPPGSLPQVITESVRRAITATGLSNVAPIDAVAQAAGTDASLQSAYRDLLRNSVQSSLRDNEDFTPERFPNASNYFNNPQ